MFTDGRQENYQNLAGLLPTIGRWEQITDTHNTAQITDFVIATEAEVKRLEGGKWTAERDQKLRKSRSSLASFRRVLNYRIALDLLTEQAGGYVIRPDQQVSFNEDIQIGPGVVVSGDPLAETVIGGAPKAGKSTLARHIAAELVDHGHRVAVVVGESIREWYAETRHYPESARPLIVRLTLDPHIQKLQIQAIEDHRATVVILDPLAKWMHLHDLSENVPAHMDSAVSLLRQFVGPDKLLLIVHHHGKTAREGLRGSNALTGSAGVVMAVAKTKPTKPTAKTKTPPGRFAVRVSEWRSGDPAAVGVGIVDLDESGLVTVARA